MRRRIIAGAVVAAAAAGMGIVAVSGSADTPPPLDDGVKAPSRRSPDILGDTHQVSVTSSGGAGLSGGRPGDACVTITLKDTEAGEGTEGVSCAPAGTLEREGLVGTYQIGDGPVLVYGVRPDAAQSVEIVGARVAQDGSVFSAVVSAALDVRVDFRYGNRTLKSVHQGKAIPQATYRVPVKW